MASAQFWGEYGCLVMIRWHLLFLLPSLVKIMKSVIFTINHLINCCSRIYPLEKTNKVIAIYHKEIESSNRVIWLLKFLWYWFSAGIVIMPIKKMIKNTLILVNAVPSGVRKDILKRKILTLSKRACSDLTRNLSLCPCLIHTFRSFLFRYPFDR